MTAERAERAAEVLDAWGEAIRSDWNDIDGRSCKEELATISAYLRGEIETLRFDDVGVCRCDGPFAHWHGNGWGTKCPYPAAESATETET